MMDQVIKGVAEDGEVLQRLVADAVLHEGAGRELDNGGDDGGEAIDRETDTRAEEAVHDRTAKRLHRIGQIAE